LKVTISPWLGIQLSSCLGVEFDEAWDFVAAHLGKDSQACRLFIMGWHGLGYRVKTIEEYSARYGSLPPYGSNSHGGNFRADQALVDYLFNACSAVECLAFAAYGIASGLDPVHFPTDNASQLRAVSREKVADLYATSWRGQELTDVLEYVRDDAAMQDLFDIRDVVTHRGTLYRTHYVGGPLHGKVAIPSNVKDLPNVWTSDLVLGAEAVRNWQGTLERLFTRSVAGVLSFRPLRAARPKPAGP
jgi:hypothetical protein